MSAGRSGICSGRSRPGSGSACGGAARIFAPRAAGRTGATNTFRALGLRWSVTVLALDAVKGAAPILIVMAVWDSPTAEVVAGLAAVVGHQLPLFAGFRGGRGAATALGGVLAIMPMGALFALGTGIPILLRVRVMSLASLTGATSAAIGMSLLAFFGGAPDAYAVFAIGTWALVLIGHKDNIERIASGTERVLSMGRSES